MSEAPPGTPDPSDEIIRDLKRKVVELEAELDNAREYGKEARIRENKAEDARIHEQMLRHAAEAREAQLREALREALAANERDRTEIVIAVNALTDAFARRDWLIRGGRGSYEWDDDRFRDEFRDAMEEFEPHVDQLRKIGADRTNCPATQAEVIAARAALSGSGSGWREPEPIKEVKALRQALLECRERAETGGRRIETAMDACEDISEIATCALPPEGWQGPAAPQQEGE